MNTQVRGMAVASRNANDGISLSQVAEGAMQKLTDILQRSRELAVQAANGTNSSSDRQALDSERGRAPNPNKVVVAAYSNPGCPQLTRVDADNVTQLEVSRVLSIDRRLDDL